MLVIGFLQWWYADGWRSLAKGVLERARRTYLHFSFPMLLRTLFAPWRRIMSASTGPLDQRVKAMLDNLVSRGVGFTIRAGALVTALLMIALTIIIGLVLIVIWPLLPLLSIGLIVGGLTL